jgi:hypothetical protein
MKNNNYWKTLQSYVETANETITLNDDGMCIWCIKIGIALVLHFNPWVEASAGGLELPEGLYSPVAKYFGTCFKIRI